MENVLLKTTLYMTALAIVIASGSAFGQPNDFAEQLMYANEQQFTLIFPKGVDNSKLIEKIERSLHLLTAAIDRKLPPDATDEAKEDLAKQQANAAVVLLRINQPAKVWPLLKHSPDPTVRSHLIHRMGTLGVDAKIIIKRLEEERDIVPRRALILSLGEFDEKALSLEDRKQLLPKLQDTYRNDTDPGLHSAAEWLLRSWKQQDWLKQVNEEWAKDSEQRNNRIEAIANSSSKDKSSSPLWYVNGQGQTMVVVPGPVEFMMGTDRKFVLEEADQPQHKKRIDRSFAISFKEVTVEQFLQYGNEKFYLVDFAPSKDYPMNTMTWYDAVGYCNWLSQKEGIPKEQWCYEPNDEGKYEAGMRIVPHFLKRTGYRLPTEAEWEYACRAGTDTRYSFGDSVDLLGKYASYAKDENIRPVAHSVGSLKPNDLGFFDMHGNVNEWCQNVFKRYAKAVNNKAIPDSDTSSTIIVGERHRVLRDGSFGENWFSLRSTYRSQAMPHFINNYLGFRPARTVPTD